MGDAEDVRVHGDDGLVIDDGGDDIGRLAAHARKAHERVDVGGNFAAEIGQQFLRHGDQVRRFRVRVGDAFHIGKNLVERGGSQVLRGGKALEKGRGDDVHPAVGTLGGQDDRHQQLEGIPVVEFGLGDGAVLGEPAHDGGETFFQGHIVRSRSKELSSISSVHFSSAQEKTRPA